MSDIESNPSGHDRGDDETSQRRKRTLTEKGQEQFDEKRMNYGQKISRIVVDINSSIMDKDLPEAKDLLNVEKLLVGFLAKYQSVCDEYHDFLKRHGTDAIILQQHMEVFNATCARVSDARKHINERLQEALERRSNRQGSVKSRSSTRSSVAARAKAESARKAVEYAKQETLLRKQQALLEEQGKVLEAERQRKSQDLKADLDLLCQVKEAAVAEAEAQVYEDDIYGLTRKPDLPVPLKLEDPSVRVENYVAQVSKLQKSNPDVHSTQQLPPVQPFQPPDQLPGSQQNFTGRTSMRFPQDHGSSLNPGVQPFYPRDLGRFLMRRDIVTSRLKPYDDKPENYIVWKTCFQSVVTELDIMDAEQLDLMIKWLGPVSSKHAASMRAANMEQPTRGLQLLWQRLDERYGAPELVESALRKRLDEFPKLTWKNHHLLYELSDLLCEIDSIKQNPLYHQLLAYLDSSVGINPIVFKLPYGVQDRWTNHAFSYKEHHNVPYPPFAYFVSFINNISKVKNDPSFLYETCLSSRPPNPTRGSVSTKKTNVSRRPSVDRHDDLNPENCPLHHAGHSLNECRRGFKNKSYEERKDFLKKSGYCYKCCTTNKHLARDCKERVKCATCGNTRHPTFLHIWKPSISGTDSPSRGTDSPPGHQGGEDNIPETVSACTQVCGNYRGGKSCAKIIPVKVFSRDRPDLSMDIYAMLDDQSNVSLAHSELFDRFGINGKKIPYTITSCSGKSGSTGRRSNELYVESMDGTSKFDVRNLIECNEIPDLREEIPTPEVALYHQHLNDIAESIPPFDPNKRILLLIGRDVLGAHHVLDQRVGTPYAQRLPLGWVIIGETCLSKIHQTDAVSVRKTVVLDNGRGSLFTPCTNSFFVKDPVFTVTADDEKPDLSIEDREFINIMDREMFMNEEGNWTAPLPFKENRRTLPDNRPIALKRAYVLDRSLKNDSVKAEHFVQFMEKILTKKHAEVAPPLKDGEEH